MKKEKVSNLKKGEFFKRTATARKVYKRGAFERSLKKYSCLDFDGTNNELFIKGDTLVFVGFTF